MNNTEGIIGGVSVVVIGGIIYKIYKAVNHKSIKIKLCGRRLSASIDIEDKETNSNITNDSSHNLKNDLNNDSSYDLKNDLKNISARKIQLAYRKYRQIRKVRTNNEFLFMKTLTENYDKI
jgi:hypothetical protein